MSWAIGFDTKWQRDIGYGVPAYCDHPGCNERINRGLAHVCGGDPYGGDEGCGLYFCAKHLFNLSDSNRPLCDACAGNDGNFPPKKDHPDWIHHKLTDESWAEWRKENPEFEAGAWAGRQGEGQ